jgi:hypothetical protein
MTSRGNEKLVIGRGRLARTPVLPPRTRAHARAPTPVEQRLAMGPGEHASHLSAAFWKFGSRCLASCWSRPETPACTSGTVSV